MITAPLLMSLVCPPTVMINETNEPWNSRDHHAYAHNKCGKNRYKNSPCVKVFTKKEHQGKFDTFIMYRVICGPMISE
jgi:hypothetical protein